MSDTTTVPTLTTVEDAHALLRQLAEAHDWVSVFWDRGWGDSGQTAEISIMVDGHGNDPKAYLTKDVYRALVNQGIVGEDTYGGFKARRIHDFKAPPVPERTGPNPVEVAERITRSVLGELHDLSVRARFSRGVNKRNALNPINEEVVETAGFDRGWYVNVSPGHSDVHISAWAGDAAGFGDKVSGQDVVYPKSDDGVIDEAGLRVLLVDAIRAQSAEVQAARAAD